MYVVTIGLLERRRFNYGGIAMKDLTDDGRRFGVFSINLDMINDHPKIVKRIMGECIVVKAEMIYIKDCIEYTAISDWFDVCELGWEPRIYRIVYHKEGNNIKWIFA